MRLFRLYALTDEDIVPNRYLLERVGDALEAGVRLFQVRFKKTPYEEQVRLGRELRELTKRYDSIFIVNDSPELAKELGADGVHLGADDPDVSYARKLLGPDAIIGLSCYDEIERVRRWGTEDISYIGVASPYPSPTKPKVKPELAKLRELLAHSKVPVYAIGGITPERVAEILKLGFYGVAVVSAIFGAKNPSEEVGNFLAELERFK
jgi:thiamine-phosphate pyrophosphorylase